MRIDKLECIWLVFGIHWHRLLCWWDTSAHRTDRSRRHSGLVSVSLFLGWHRNHSVRWALSLDLSRRSLSPIWCYRRFVPFWCCLSVYRCVCVYSSSSFSLSFCTTKYANAFTVCDMWLRMRLFSFPGVAQLINTIGFHTSNIHLAIVRLQLQLQFPYYRIFPQFSYASQN